MFVIVCQDDRLEVRAVVGTFDLEDNAFAFMRSVSAEGWGELTRRTVLPIQSRDSLKEQG
jgi:hypothetical protein